MSLLILLKLVRAILQLLPEQQLILLAVILTPYQALLLQVKALALFQALLLMQISMIFMPRLHRLIRLLQIT